MTRHQVVEILEQVTRHQVVEAPEQVTRHQVAGGTRKRVLVLISLKAVSSLWPTNDGTNVVAIFVKILVSVSKVIDQHRIGTVCLIYRLLEINLLSFTPCFNQNG